MVSTSALEHLLRCDRQVRVRVAGRVIDGVGYCGCHRNGSQLNPRPERDLRGARPSEADLR